MNNITNTMNDSIANFPDSLYSITRSLVLTVLGLVMCAILHYRKSKLCRGCTFSNAVKIMIFISDVQYYVPIKLCKTAGSICVLKIIGTLKPENIKLN